MENVFCSIETDNQQYLTVIQEFKEKAFWGQSLAASFTPLPWSGVWIAILGPQCFNKFSWLSACDQLTTIYSYVNTL